MGWSRDEGWCLSAGMEALGSAGGGDVLDSDRVRTFRGQGQALRRLVALSLPVSKTPCRQPPHDSSSVLVSMH